MRKHITLDQYISAPLTQEEIAYYDKREQRKAIAIFTVAALVFLTTLSIDIYDLPSSLMAAVACSVISGLLTAFIVFLLMDRNDLKIINESELTPQFEFMFSSFALKQNEEKLVIPDVQRLLTNVKALDRDIIKLEAYIVRKLFCEQIKLKTKELFAKEGVTQ